MMNSLPLSASPAAPVAAIGVETFAPYVADVFQLMLGEGNAEPLVLLSATASKHAPAGFRLPFTLIFRASSREFYVPQAIYPLEHPQAGRFDLFIVPLGPDDAGMLFQAVFN